MYRCVYLHVGMYIWVLVPVEARVVGSPGVTEGGVTWIGCWEPNSAPLIEQQVLLNPEPFLQPHDFCSSFLSSFYYPETDKQLDKWTPMTRASFQVAQTLFDQPQRHVFGTRQTWVWKYTSEYLESLWLGQHSWQKIHKANCPPPMSEQKCVPSFPRKS